MGNRVAVGFLAVPILTVSAAYNLAQAAGWKHGLSTKPREAKKFYAAITVFTAVAVGPEPPRSPRGG